MADPSSQEQLWALRHQLVSDLLAELRGRASDPREVQLIETHISWVLLGSEVYKIKKPVTLPFLDFASFEARERACRTEVRINRRLAPRTYLGVVPIRRRADGRFTLAADLDGAVAEWAVQMTRLDETLRADVLLEKGALGRVQVDALAHAIAAFHADSSTGPDIRRLGSADVIERNVSDNFAALRGWGEGVVPDVALAEIERWQLDFVRARRFLFEQRMRAGAIRDGHGDLRLEHVFFREPADDFEVIDGIEFDDRYRYADVCADIAFLAMDLARLGRVDLAERFVATYARAANDFELYRLLDFYESYRACVRAKISAGAMVSSQAPVAVVEAARADARRYLLFAQSARRRAVLDPVLVAVAGSIATGKSTLAERLGQELSAPVVDADRTRKHMIGLAPTDHAAAGAWQGAYDPAFSERVYAEVLQRADAVLASGRPVIIDASFRSADARRAARQLAVAHGVPFRLFECVAPLDVCRSRLAAREQATSVSDATPGVLDAFSAGYEPIIELPPSEHVRMDTGGTADEALAAAMRAIATWPRGFVG
ncbi:MAG TPA: AAA family ATPase [Labilithrix sp.]|nr:AAA family ATPase [Labilithrix sp.]